MAPDLGEVAQVDMIHQAAVEAVVAREHARSCHSMHASPAALVARECGGQAGPRVLRVE